MDVRLVLQTMLPNDILGEKKMVFHVHIEMSIPWKWSLHRELYHKSKLPWMANLANCCFCLLCKKDCVVGESQKANPTLGQKVSLKVSWLVAPSAKSLFSQLGGNFFRSQLHSHTEEVYCGFLKQQTVATELKSCNSFLLANLCRTGWVSSTIFNKFGVNLSREKRCYLSFTKTDVWFPKCYKNSWVFWYVFAQKGLCIKCCCGQNTICPFQLMKQNKKKCCEWNTKKILKKEKKWHWRFFFFCFFFLFVFFFFFFFFFLKIFNV